MQIKLTIEPAVAPVQLLTRTTSAEVSYRRAVGDGEARVDLQDSARFELDTTLKGSILLDDAAAADLQLAILAPDGSILISTTATAVNGAAMVAISDENVATIRDGAQKLPETEAPIPMSRLARLVLTGTIQPDFARSSVMVVPLADQAALNQPAVAAFLNVGGQQVASIEVSGEDLRGLSSMSWMPARLSVDGTIAALFAKSESAGWLWWLLGEHQVLGYVPDDLSVDKAGVRVIPLPALAPAARGAKPAGDCGCQGKGGTCGHDTRVPTDVSEAELADNADVYTEDPGAFCRPFSSPERVLGERSFAVIARATQPAIGAKSSVKSRVMAVLTLDSDVAPSAARSPGLVRRIRSVFQPGASQPALAMTAAPARYALPTDYANLLGTFPSGRSTMDSNHPLQWEDDIAQYQAATIALGHILEFRVRWRSNGYSLGNVAKTLTLAPRQVKRIQKIAWHRTERAIRAERTQLRDQENDSTVRERSYLDEVAAHLDEWATGGSSSDTEAAAGGIGFLAGPVIGGIGGGAASAHSSSHQEGGRDTTASERQRLRDAIRRHGDAVRRLESTVVNEVSQDEEVTGTTETIRNANYAHALTVIYYQILRHLKVSTEFAGVRECLFVPFSIKPFDLARAYRWRESLQAAMRSPVYSRALRYVKDVLNNFATSDILPGPRANQRLTYVRGSIYVDLAVERPPESANGIFDAAAWAVLQPLLSTPATGVFGLLSAMSASVRDSQFQTAHAPGIAAKWADRLQLRVGSRLVRADFTLATRYQFNRSVRIDFAVPASELGGLSRMSLQQMAVVAGQGLPAGSVANLTRMQLTYNTERFEHAVEALGGTNDLVAPGTGTPGQASRLLPLDDWERVDEQQEIRRSVAQLLEHLNEHVEFYHKAIWWRMDRDRLLMLLDGFFVPNTNGVSIASIVDREPVGIIGNSLVYRVGAASFLGMGKIRTPAELYNLYATKEPISDPLLISIPTDGLYAQSIMDECAALEEHYGNTDWVLADKEPDLGSIDPSLMQSRRADSSAVTTPTAFPSTIIQLQNAPDAPAPSGLSGVLGAVTNANAFRDMAGLAGTQANAMGALNTAASLATNFGNQAAQLEMAKLAKADQATKTADQKIASIRNAMDKGLTTPADAAQATRESLAAMNPDAPKAAAPHEDPTINSVIGAARTAPGSTIEASTGEGAVKVTMGQSGTLLASTSEPIQQHCAFFGSSAVATELEVREAVRVAVEAERQDWFPGGAAATEDDPDQFGKLVQYWLCRTGEIRPATLTAIQALTVDPAINYGQLTDPAATAPQVNAEVVAVRAFLLGGVPGAATPGLAALVETALRDARTSGVIMPVNTRDPWSAAFVSAAIRRAAIAMGLDVEASGTHVGKNGLLLAHEAHRGYVVEADRRTKAGSGGTYHAFSASNRVIQAGDIVIQDRQANAIGDVWQFANIPALAGGRKLHGDIVISVDAAAGHAITIGGNLGNSARRRRYPLTADGMLVIDRTQLYTQENDAGALPAVPVVSAAAGLPPASTGRIFAVLSPVHQCVVIPGQQVAGGVLV